MNKKIENDPYLKACEVLGITPLPVLKDRSDKDQVSVDAYARLIVCIRAKNLLPDGKVWMPVYNRSEWHYYPWWKKTSSGLGFSLASYGSWSSSTTVGPRLEYRTRELMLEGVKEFEQYYADYLNN